MRPEIPEKDIPGADPELLVQAFLPWVKRLALRYTELIKRSGAFDLDDLIQAGSLALMEAQKNYDPERGSFLGFSKFYIMKAMRNEIGFNNQTGELPPVPLSLDAPANNNPDNADTALGDIIPDTDAEPPDEYAERMVICDEVHKAVDRLKDPKKIGAITRIYFNDMSRQEAADDMGVTRAVVIGAEHRALIQLRHDYRLHNIIEPSFHVGVHRFNSTFCSEVEEAILRKERKIDSKYGTGSYANDRPGGT